MTHFQLRQYDRFLDENDWDIYYWATQSQANSPTSLETAEGSIDPPAPRPRDHKSSTSTTKQDTDAWRLGAPRSGEWAQTIGAFKPAYRPVPERWRDSEILSLLRKHVRERSAGGVLEDVIVDDIGKKGAGEGLGRMPDVSIF